jgi:hypothetical protein
MNHKIVFLLLGAVAAGTISARAQSASSPAPSASAPAAAPAPDAPAPDALSVTFTPSYVSTYMFRGQRLGGQSLEPSLEADYGNAALGVWTNAPFNNQNKVPGQSNPEIDPYGSYTFNLTSSLSLQPGFTWYTYAKAPLNQGFYRMTFEPNLAVNYTVDGVKFTPKFYYDVVLHTATYEFDAAYAVPLKSLGSELDFSGSVGTYKGTDVTNTGSIPNPVDTSAWGNYWQMGASMPFTLTSSIKLVAGWAYTEGTSAYTKTGSLPKTVNPEAVGRGVATGSFVWTF